MKKHIRLYCLLLAVLASLTLVSAQDGTATDETSLVLADAQQDIDVNLPSSSLVPYLLRMVVVLAVILAAIYGLYVLLRRKAVQTQNEDPFIRVIGAVPLAPGRSVHVVSVGSRAWLVGSGEGTVSLLTELDDKDVIEAMVKRAEENPKQYRGDFSSILAAMVPNKTSSARPANAARQSNSISGFLARQKDRLKRF